MLTANVMPVVDIAPGLGDHYARCAKSWKDAKFHVRESFVRLRLIYSAETARFSERDAVEFGDINALLDETGDASLILLGPPGSGKTTLLRRLLLDQASALHDRRTSVAPFLVSLNRFVPSADSDMNGCPVTAQPARAPLLDCSSEADFCCFLMD